MYIDSYRKFPVHSVVLPLYNLYINKILLLQCYILQDAKHIIFLRQKLLFSETFRLNYIIKLNFCRKLLAVTLSLSSVWL